MRWTEQYRIHGIWQCPEDEYTELKRAAPDEKLATNYQDYLCFINALADDAVSNGAALVCFVTLSIDAMRTGLSNRNLTWSAADWQTVANSLAHAEVDGWQDILERGEELPSSKSCRIARLPGLGKRPYIEEAA